MIRRFTLLLFGLSILYILSVASSSGRASAANEGNTGAPGDNPKVCASCHSGGSFNPTVQISVMDENGNEVNEYIPNTQYQVEVNISVSNGSPNGYGFQMVSLRDADNSGISAWSNPSSNAKIASAMGRSYVEHAGVSTSNVFMVDWLAPEQGTGSVSFYAAGNSVNKNGSTSGDAATTNNIQIQEAVTSSVEFSIPENGILIYPNPIQDELRIFLDNEEVLTFELIDYSGRLIRTGIIAAGENIFDTGTVPAGQYLLRTMEQDGSGISMHKLIKL